MEAWTVLVVHLQLQPNEAWRVTTHEYNELMDCKLAKESGKKKLDSDGVQDLKADLMAAQIAEQKERDELRR